MLDVDTIAAVATSAGVGGIGIVRISGPRVPQIMNAIAGRRLQARMAAFVRFRDSDGSPLDEGIALFFPGPRSYTGEDVLELHGHGGAIVLNSLLRRCIEAGARLAQPGEFTKRAFLNGKLDLVQAEAVADLIAAGTERAAKSAAQSLSGEFSRRVQQVQIELTDIRVLLEGSLDFPEEGIDFLREARAAERLAELARTLADALRAARAGQLLNDGVMVVIVGPPNAGKSSIINELSRDDIAIVAPEPGTTRDLVRSSLSIRGVPFHVVDTAGLRESTDTVERAGIARTWRAISIAQLIVCVEDCSKQTAEASHLAETLPPSVRRIHVHNKIDLLGVAPHAEQRADATHVWISAKEGAGIGLLEDAMVGGLAAAETTEGAFSARDRHLQALQRALESVDLSRGRLDSPELAAEDLRTAQAALSEITGEMIADDLLGQIFSRFCIGK